MSRIWTVLLALAIAFAPLAQNPMVAPAQAHVSELDAFLRLVPAVAGAMGGFMLGSSLGIVGKIGGTLIGWQAGKLIGRFLSGTIGGVFTPTYYATPIFGGMPWAPASTGPAAPAANLGDLREKWLDAVRGYEDALKTGDATAKQARRATLEAAEKAYFDAKK